MRSGTGRRRPHETPASQPVRTISEATSYGAVRRFPARRVKREPRVANAPHRATLALSGWQNSLLASDRPYETSLRT